MAWTASAPIFKGVDSVYDVRWSEDRTYAQVRLLEEQEFSAYNFEYADPVITRNSLSCMRRRPASCSMPTRSAPPKRTAAFPSSPRTITV